MQKTISKLPTQKSWVFQPPPKAEQFPPKFHGLVLGLIGLIDAIGIDVAQSIWSWGCPTKAQEQPKKTENAFFVCFWAYVGQPHDHIHWATSMPFASINPTNPRTNPWNFGGNCSAFGGGWKTQFFWVGHFEKKICNFFFFFCLIPMKTRQSLLVSKDGPKF